ncbi:MAG TPA: TIGR03067 domain-containing protein, partial [Dongiaceae bacterium]|nr:TIGR03067 domain-containing protein [Dongiaceae bacterium]
MPSDLDLLQGSWRITALEVEGREMPGEMLADGRITIQGDRFTSTGMGAEYTGTITLDAFAAPRRLDMHFDAGPEKGNTNFGIYELDGDRWRICLATRGAVRPSRFNSTEGGGFVLETLARGAATLEPKRRASAKGA